jgi:hypothetical protein
MGFYRKIPGYISNTIKNKYDCLDIYANPDIYLCEVCECVLQDISWAKDMLMECARIFIKNH